MRWTMQMMRTMIDDDDDDDGDDDDSFRFVSRDGLPYAIRYATRVDPYAIRYWRR